MHDSVVCCIARPRLLTGEAAAPRVATLRCAALLLSLLLLTSLANAKGEPVKFAAWKGGATPSLVLKDTKGKEHDLAAYRGKLVLVNFWATWCEPCVEEMPSLEDLQDRFKGRPFAVLTVNMGESDAKVTQFLQSTLLRDDGLTVLYDRFGTAGKAWKARMLPVTFMVGEDGRIRQSLLGAANWTSPEVIKQIEQLMPKKR